MYALQSIQGDGVRREVDVEEVDNAAAFTCRFTAGLRHVEGTACSNPLLQDGLAAQLAGAKALALAEQELANLRAAQGAGKHLRVPARTRILDDDLLAALDRLAGASDRASSACNVVALGAGMDTRPWRLSFPPENAQQVRWYDCDFPVIVDVKKRLLAAARAQISKAAGLQAPTAPPSSPLPSTSNSASKHGPDVGTKAKSAGSKIASEAAAEVGKPVLADSPGSCAAPDSVSGPAFTLKTTAWAAIGSDLADGNLAAHLKESSFDATLPTIWLAEAVLYYLKPEQATNVLRSAAALSAHGSFLLATCVDTELLEASRNLQADHVFANLWHFDMHDMDRAGGMLAQAGWCVMDAPKTTKALALDRYGADTYAAAYGGAECVFGAALRGTDQ